MITTEQSAATKAPPAPRPSPSAVARMVARYSGSAVSLLVHGILVALAFLSVAAPRMGRGGGIVGTASPGAVADSYPATMQQESLVEASKSADARLFSQPEPEPETPEILPPPTPEDFIQEQSENGIPVARLPQPAETTPPARSKEAYAKLPPTPPPSEPSEGPSGDGGTQKGTQTVNGIGGDTGGAGEGRIGCLYMPSPDYPFSARRKSIEGAVVIEIDVYPDGHVDDARIVSSSGCDALDEAAMTAIRKWKYERMEAKEIRRVRFVFKLNK
jgi:TonB family protein